MLHMWVTVTTVVNTALAVAGLGVAGYAVTAKPGFVLFYYAVAFICVLGAAVGFVNLYFLNDAVRRNEEKNRPAREERERKKAERAAKKAEREAARAEKQAQKEAAQAAKAAQAEQQAAVQGTTDEALAPEEPSPGPAPQPEEPEGNDGEVEVL